MVPDQALITLEREETRPTVESDEPILAAAGTNCENQSSPTNSINNNSCVSDNFQKQLDIPNSELWESLIGMCILTCYDDMVRDLGEISYEDWLTTNDSSPS